MFVEKHYLGTCGEFAANGMTTRLLVACAIENNKSTTRTHRLSFRHRHLDYQTICAFSSTGQNRKSRTKIPPLGKDGDSTNFAIDVLDGPVFHFLACPNPQSRSSFLLQLCRTQIMGLCFSFPRRHHHPMMGGPVMVARPTPFGGGFGGGWGAPVVAVPVGGRMGMPGRMHMGGGGCGPARYGYAYGGGGGRYRGRRW
jgi:hypothetical protein